MCDDRARTLAKQTKIETRRLLRVRPTPVHDTLQVQPTRFRLACFDVEKKTYTEHMHVLCVVHVLTSLNGKQRGKTKRTRRHTKTPYGHRCGEH